MEAKERVNIICSQHGYIGTAIQDLVEAWHNNMPAEIEMCYPNDIWEAADVYLNTHDWNDFLALAAVVDDSNLDVSLSISEVYGIPHDRFKYLAQRWYSKLSDSEKQELPTDICEAADRWAKENSFHELCLKADIRENAKAYLRLQEIFLKQGIPEEEHRDAVFSILDETEDDERYRYSVDLYEAALSNIDKRFGSSVIMAEIDNWIEDIMRAARREAPGYISDSVYGLLSERIEKAIKYPFD